MDVDLDIKEGFVIMVVASPVLERASRGSLAGGFDAAELVSPASVASVLVFFFRFFPDPDTFFSEWVSPWSLSCCDREARRSLSAVEVGNMAMTLSG